MWMNNFGPMMHFLSLYIHMYKTVRTQPVIIDLKIVWFVIGLLLIN